MKRVILFSFIVLCLILMSTSCKKEQEKDVYVFNVHMPFINDEGQIASHTGLTRRLSDVLLVESDPVAGQWLFCYENTPQDTLLYLTRDENGTVKGELKTVLDWQSYPGQISFPMVEGEMKEQDGVFRFNGNALCHCLFDHTGSGQYYEQVEGIYPCSFSIVSINKGEQPEYTMTLDGTYIDDETGKERGLHLKLKHIFLYDKDGSTAYFRNGDKNYYDGDDLYVHYADNNYVSPQGYMDLSRFDERFKDSHLRLEPVKVTNEGDKLSFSGSFKDGLTANNTVQGTFVLTPR